MTPFVIPAHRAMVELREELARGGRPPLATRGPEDCVRITSFDVISALLRLLRTFKHRVEAGERCRLVAREHAPELGRLHIEIAIEAGP